ncbi:ABC transporter substrate-binding protein [Pasteurellaceae bacterium 20609_3]|uniref:ABC transporter substrate-binding protein n=1 Tax=Spirabiliibacterium mucosae TaxID=28156 RepID=UPI001AACE5A1|nr:ABC transporter substrate-binding protein [Spirabiliibacterium mucosae]MBE2898770.1 ABC transporter substrate-binding protein [Spirabiliibacterium mucosae]
MAWADRQITDQLDRQVTIPDTISRAVVLQHQTLDIAVQLDATDQIVGILSTWKKNLGKDYVRLAPQLEKMAMPGELTKVNIESLLSLKPDVVFVTNYAPPEMIKQISDAGLPVIAISLRVSPKDEQAKLNPTLQDENEAYSEGLKQGIALIANVFNKQQNGEALIKAAFANRPLLKARLANVPKGARVPTYMANPDLTTYGSGKYTGLMMEHAGANNVAASTIKGYKQVSMEQVLSWNPSVIFVQNRYPDVVPEIVNGTQWQNIQAVKDKKVYLMPQYAKAWGYPMPEAVGLGELWMAKKLYPERFADIDLDKMVNDYYQKFYRTHYVPTPAKQ